MKRFFTFLAAACCLTAMQAQQLAFPGAVGFGRYATGGRYGSVYHVTNLNDSGAGSLRDAVSKPNRIVVFDVSGVINISSRMSFAANLYVAGQTAPGEGVIVYGDGVSFSAADNIIVRYMKFRMGKGGTSGKDAAGVANGVNMIFDHCSFAWGLDETFSINWDNKGKAPQNITLSNCVVGQGLLAHSAGGLIQSDSITLYRNFYCDNSTRNNKVKGASQYVNCIVYNWQDGCYLMGGDSQGKETPSRAETATSTSMRPTTGRTETTTACSVRMKFREANTAEDRLSNPSRSTIRSFLHGNPASSSTRSSLKWERHSLTATSPTASWYTSASRSEPRAPSCHQSTNSLSERLPPGPSSLSPNRPTPTRTACRTNGRRPTERTRPRTTP